MVLYLFLFSFLWGGCESGIFVHDRWTLSDLCAAHHEVVGAVSIVDMHEVMAPYAFWFTMASYVASVIGDVVFACQWSDPWPDAFGFHEIMHSLTTTASLFVYIANISIISRCS